MAGRFGPAPTERPQAVSEARILVVDDDPGIRELVGEFLEDYGFEVNTAADGAALLLALEARPPDLVLLDLKLPDQGGLGLVEHVKAVGDIPVIMLTSLGADVDRIVGLEVGADDYVPKPFNPRELLARIRAVLRRTAKAIAVGPPQGVPHEVLVFAGWSLDLTVRELRDAAGQHVELTGAEFDLLAALASAPQRVLSREQLLDRTRGHGAEVFDRSIDVLILRLRRKIEDNPKNPRLIRTERSVGYVFTAPVERC